VPVSLRPARVSAGRCKRGAGARTLVRHRGADALREHRLRREARAHALERGRDGRGGCDAGRVDARVRRELRGRELALEDEHLPEVVVEPRARAREQRDEPLRERDLLVRERLRGRIVRGGLGVHVVTLLVELPAEAVLQVLGRVFVGVLQQLCRGGREGSAGAWCGARWVGVKMSYAPGRSQELKRAPCDRASFRRISLRRNCTSCGRLSSATLRVMTSPYFCSQVLHTEHKFGSESRRFLHIRDGRHGGTSSEEWRVEGESARHAAVTLPLSSGMSKAEQIGQERTYGYRYMSECDVGNVTVVEKRVWCAADAKTHQGWRMSFRKTRLMSWFIHQRTVTRQLVERD
jgi:hypothetical protein